VDGIGWLGIFVATLGIAMVVWGLNSRSKANALVAAAQAWPVVPGTITATDILRGGTNRAPTFSPVARYEYEVDGRKYYGDRLRPGYVKVGSRGAADRMLQPYPAGAVVPVRYDPTAPSSSLLELKTSSAPLMTAGAGAFLFLMGAGIAAAAVAGIFSENDRARRSATVPPLASGFASGQPIASSERIGGQDSRTWRGSYTCGQGETGLEVTLRPIGQGRLDGTLSFFPLPANPGVPRGCFLITGQAHAASHSIELRGGQWLRQPPGYEAIDLSGRVDANGRISGQVVGGVCNQFQLEPVLSAVESCP
jgi:hypothetical protein